ncbi:hypothetical protein SARC_03738 [Sphaeroforma arctica JP610]|uniref:Nudix hydrolase domain-containing protein n=1 Tax=Sphaeroforma arctica JP610 TaxID=667725 RepID=A0A0L0G4M3_9EUKA|nr:hypothetical protein SARC_03738 [Sphaeroforma arctica JP610]KNC84027.1 hypothetical protein SARC_03738 [Sphaeroforma arctica JP610]|eukprot:XP_014157929.1 hypothetical protein SARC_03738 [Sphaeroforma arctica JP610]
MLAYSQYSVGLMQPHIPSIRYTAKYMRTTRHCSTLRPSMCNTNISLGSRSIDSRASASLQRLSPLRYFRRSHVNSPENWKEHSHHNDTAAISAATVLLIRDGADGLETLLLRKNAKITFGGMWVYPGGKVDDDDRIGLQPHDDITAARRAAARETEEETGLKVDIDLMLPFAHWRPPNKVLPRVYLTWFLLAPAPKDCEVTIDDGEILEYAWMSPQGAIDKRNRGEIELAPPTYVSLLDMSQWHTVREAMDAVRQRTPEHYETQFSRVQVQVQSGVPGEENGQAGHGEGLKKDQVVLLWHGDEHFTPFDGVVGARHRMTMGKEWIYQRNI